MFWLAILVVVLTVLFWWYWYEFRRLNKPLESLPGPPNLPLLGCALEFKSTDVVLQRMMDFKQRYGRLLRIRIGPMRSLVLMSDVEDVKFMLSHMKHITKSRNYKFLHRWLGKGLLTSDGELWKRHRRIITPTFHFKILEGFVEVFNNASDIMMRKLKQELGKDSFDVYPYISLCALDIICESAMGTKVNAQDDGDSEYVKSVKEMCRIIIERSFSAVKMYDALYFFTKDYQIERHSLEVLQGYTKDVIRRKKAQLAKEKTQPIDKDDLGIKKRMAFLDVLIRESKASEKPLTDKEICEEVDTFMFEGHDTTATAMSFIAFSLAEYPDIQKKVLKELDSIFESDRTKCATFKDLQAMNYLDLVIKESLRLYPSVPFYARKLKEDCEHNGIVYAAGTSMMIFAYGMHRDPEYFPDPEKFIPERFEAENKLSSPYIYVPFSAGPRNCIGQKFAMLEMKSMISKLVRNYELLPAIPEHKLMLTAETVLKSVNGIRIRLKERV